MVLKETVLIWNEVEINLFQNIDSKGMHHRIPKTGIKQIRINNVHLKKITKMNLSLTHYPISGQYCIHVETSQLISRGY